MRLLRPLKTRKRRIEAVLEQLLPARRLFWRSRGKLSDLRETGYTDILSLERLAAVLAALV
jgi:hypothetical protein